MWWIPVAQLVASATPAVVEAVRKGVERKRGSSTSSTRSSSSTSSRPHFTPEQKEQLRTIAHTIASAPLPQTLAKSRNALTVAAWVNAWHESRLDPSAHNTRGEDSVGLFQINRQGALGRRYSVAQLMDPGFNTRVILSEVWTRQTDLDRIVRHGGTVADLTAAFTEHVERPANAQAESRRRSDSVYRWWGPKVGSARAYGFLGG